MAFLPYLFGFVLIAVALVWGRGLLQQRKRDRLLATSLTPEQRMAIDRLVPLVNRMPPDLQVKLDGKINLFLDQVTFRGQNGLEVNEAMRLSIAAQACLLIVNSTAWYDTIRTVLVYPSVFRTRRPMHDGQLVHERDFHMAGESWVRGPVVLSWDDALQGGLDADDGYNVVIHEFAHQLDSLTGHTNGIPMLSKGQDYEGWEKAMLQAFEKHVTRLQHGHPTLIDPYGATNHEEFFAEAIVTFFERPVELRHEEPALYAQLAKLLSLDPAGWG
ncbi:MAG: zinc-dependent peptidase [Erythrobacter sp.]|nr:zinc-dependent peptidase [Erythrobacter sp.]